MERKRLFARAVVVLAASVVTAGVLAATANAQNYILLYKQNAVSSDVATTVQKAGGTLVYSYPQIGVAIASSDSASFRDDVLKDNRIENAAGTAAYATQLPSDSTEASPGDLPNAPATDSDTFSGLQWDMRQIHTPEAHAITGGSPAVVVGDIDTGLDKDHPDLIPNIDFSRSVSCVGGVPNQSPTAWDDDNGHGTHTAGTIAAASNGIGVVGVAPNVKVAGIKAGNTAGFFFPEAVVCAFMWAGTHQIDVTNNSYFADPWLFNCKNDPVQRAIWKAEQRAIRFAMQSGVTVVASEGNESEDLSHPSMDITSPDDQPTPEEREVTNACVVIPVEIPGVIGVTADGNRRQVDGDDDPDDFLKSYYSSFGVSTADVVAPGGDFFYGQTPEAVNGLVLSTWPAEIGGSRRLTDPGDATHPSSMYRYIQGTSMAAPHVAGVAALIVSVFGDLNNPKNGKMQPGKVSSMLQQTADAQPCPTELPASGAPGTSLFGVPYSAITGSQSDTLQVCQGGPSHNSWYGAGQVNALRAILHDSGGN
ncbi:MAG TPA: S8 family serine peptidase [Gaiellaceae bacterium]|nr:S8 family serine peptidase [Gaiellaceae bacterium]